MEQDLTDRRTIVPDVSSASPAGHGYAVDGRVLVSVTKVIGTVLRAPQLEEWMKRMGSQADVIRDEAAAFGKSVDAALTAFVGGNRLVPLDMPDNWRLTLEAGKRWLSEHVEEVYAVQQPIASLKYGYAGTPDLYCRLRRQKLPTFIDYKATGDIYWSHRAQLAAYRQAGKESYPDRPAGRLILHLDKDEPGKVRAYPLKHHERDFALFGYLLGAYNIMKTGVKS